MSVAALSAAGFSQYISASSNVSASQQAFQSLQQSLASGNLTAAQSAFNTFQQLNQAPATGTGSSSTASQFATDLTALGSAIGSGNLSTAQSAFATLQTALSNSPSQAVTNAESAAAQTVQWVDDLLNYYTSANDSTTTAEPTTAILDSAYGLNNSSNTTDPTTSILNSADDPATTTSTTSGTTSIAATSAAGNPKNILSTGNAGSGASVNAYA